MKSGEVVDINLPHKMIEAVEPKVYEKRCTYEEMEAIL